jgi:hypothetical protein
MTGYRDCTGFDRVLVLAMAAALYDEEPPFGGKTLDHFADFHSGNPML